MKYTRFSICITPAPDSDLARLGKHWLGWDIDQGAELPFLKIENLPAPFHRLTARLRRYGFRAPLTAPFELAPGHSPLSLHHTAQALASHLETLEFPGLYLSSEDAHLSLRPLGDTDPLERLHHIAQEVFSGFHAPPASAPKASARRRPELSREQMQVLIDRSSRPAARNRAPFEFPLTDQRAQAETDQLRRRLLPILSPNLPRPFRVGALTLCGEGQSGWVRVIQRYAMTGGGRVHHVPSAQSRPEIAHVPLWS